MLIVVVFLKNVRKVQTPQIAQTVLGKNVVAGILSVRKGIYKIFRIIFTSFRNPIQDYAETIIQEQNNDPVYLQVTVS